jgi:hypothetical protein
MDNRIKYFHTSNACVFFKINGHLSASDAKGILLKENYLQIDSPLTGELEAKRYFKENPTSTLRLHFLSKPLGVEHYQHSIKEGDTDIVKQQIVEKGFARTFTGNPSLALLQPGDIVVVMKYTGN